MLIYKSLFLFKHIMDRVLIKHMILSMNRHPVHLHHRVMNLLFVCVHFIPALGML